MGWQKAVFYGAVGWTALLLALVVYLFFLIISGQPADGLSFAIVAGLGGVLGVLGMVVCEVYLGRRLAGKPRNNPHFKKEHFMNK
jgi:hypothetical protein